MNIDLNGILSHPGSRPRRALTRPRQPASIRIAPRPGNRHYLRALRAAELAAWQEPKSASARVAGSRMAEARLFALLSLLGVAAVAHRLLVSDDFAQHWSNLLARLSQFIG
jgi:hypothetical protein